MIRKLDVPWTTGVALALVGTLALAHLLGGRDAVSVLSGTPPDGPIVLLAPLGLAYTLSWLATVLVAPPLFLAGAIEWILRRRARAGPETTSGSSSP